MLNWTGLETEMNIGMDQDKLLVLNLESYVSYDYNINLKIAFLCFM